MMLRFDQTCYYGDAKSFQIVEGSSNVQGIIIAQDALGYRKANR